MQGYALEVKKYMSLANFLWTPTLSWLVLDGCCLTHFSSSHEKELINAQKSPFLRPRCSEDHGPVPLLEYTQSCKESCDSMNNKTQLHYHELSHSSHMILQAKQAEQLNWLWLLCLLWYWCRAVEMFNVAFCCFKQAIKWNFTAS